jgi:NAD(P)-dependent dehydrogenase (short-subunit alcohol dehydrogenase family)
MIREWFDFSGKVILITGASRGIGEALARGFCELGGEVVLTSRKQESLDKVAGQIKDKGGKACAIACHIGKDEDRQKLIDQVLGKYGRIDVLVNNAATNPLFGPAMDATQEAWDKIFDVNLKGPFFLSKMVAARMAEKGGGAIVNVASVAGIKPMMGLGVYSISKAGLLMMTKVLASELGEKAIRVNAVAPGVIKTKFSEALWKNDFIRKAVEQTSPLGRIGETDDVIGAVIFLASDAAKYITGETLVVNGGTGLKGA